MWKTFISKKMRLYRFKNVVNFFRKEFIFLFQPGIVLAAKNESVYTSIWLCPSSFSTDHTKLRCNRVNWFRHLIRFPHLPAALLCHLIINLLSFPCVSCYTHKSTLATPSLPTIHTPHKRRQSKKKNTSRHAI